MSKKSVNFFGMRSSLAARAADRWLRRIFKPRLAAAATLGEAREILDLRLPYAPPVGGFRSAALGGVTGEWTLAGREDAPALLYLHGGAYFAGSARQYRPITAFFARQGFDVFAPDYRLAPAHPFPAGVEDARSAWDALLSERAEPVALAGDSAGGGLCLALALALRDAGAPLPAAMALFSPWTDLAVTGESARDNEERDAMFTRRMLKIAARAYLGPAHARAPLASPLYAELRGLSPLLIHASRTEMLRDDSTRLAARAGAAGVAVELELWDGVPHGWQLAAAHMPEARESLEKAAAFLAARLTEGVSRARDLE